ncbi:MAG: glycosyltransferase family 4 protein, partial [Anaerolineales bacterium]|nr:glycosyltransferase family 4 protein [Anaerolineales bacterium]
AGDGPERAELQVFAARHKDAVQFLGIQSQQRVHHLMRAADVFVLFSTYEGLPHTVLEAMTCRTPVVASAVGGTVEVVTDGRTGLLVPIGDEEALGAAICRVLKEPDFGRALADRAHGKLGRFSWEQLLADTEAALLEAAA